MSNDWRNNMPICFFKKESVLDVFEKMSNLPFQFYLAGSRYMEVEDNQSDWDFIAEDSKEIQEALKNIGFRYILTGSGYIDTNCSSVMQHKNPQIPIHIQLSRNINTRLAAQFIVKNSQLAAELHIMKRTNKEQYQRMGTAIWNALYDILDGKYEQPIASMLNNLTKDQII